MPKRRPTSTPTSSPVRALLALAAPAQSLGRDVAQVLGQPRAFFGGLVATALLCAGVVAAMSAEPAADNTADEEAIEFNAGVLTPLGIVYPDEVMVITAETRTVETPVDPTPEVIEPEPDTVPEQVTRKPTPNPTPKPTATKPTPVKPKPLPEPPKETGEVAEHNSTSNNPYPDPPTVDQNPGDPFGDVNGWGELVKDGDPWATEVMRRLNAMKVPAWAAQTPNGRYSFRLRVCSDGRVDKVFTKRTSGDAGLDAAVRGELMRTALPPMSAKVQKHMSGRCSTLKYSFVWGAGRVR